MPPRPKKKPRAEAYSQYALLVRSGPSGQVLVSLPGAFRLVPGTSSGEFRYGDRNAATVAIVPQALVSEQPWDLQAVMAAMQAVTDLQLGNVFTVVQLPHDEDRLGMESQPEVVLPPGTLQAAENVLATYQAQAVAQRADADLPQRSGLQQRQQQQPQQPQRQGVVDDPMEADAVQRQRAANSQRMANSYQATSSAHNHAQDTPDRSLKDMITAHWKVVKKHSQLVAITALQPYGAGDKCPALLALAAAEVEVTKRLQWADLSQPSAAFLVAMDIMTFQVACAKAAASPLRMDQQVILLDQDVQGELSEVAAHCISSPAEFKQLADAVNVCVKNFRKEANKVASRHSEAAPPAASAAKALPQRQQYQPGGYGGGGGGSLARVPLHQQSGPKAPKVCNFWASSGSCPYSPGCKFLHHRPDVQPPLPPGEQPRGSGGR